MDYDPKLDSRNMFQNLKNFPKQVEEAAKLGKDVKINENINNIIFSGIGGSCLPAGLLKTYVGTKVPFIINRSYSFPEFANNKTLAIISSYSGETQETLSCFRQALKKECRIVAVTTGGKLAELCRLNSVPCIIVPKAGETRENLGSMLIPLLNVLSNTGLIKDYSEEIAYTIKALSKPDFRERAKALAEKLHKKIPIIYSSDRIEMVPYIWKIHLNETSKIHAFCNSVPEMNHNEMSGYDRLNGDYYVLIIEDEEDYKNIKDRMALMKEIISRQGVETMKMVIKGKYLLTRMLSTVYLGWLASYYLALKNGVDPSLTPLQAAIKTKVE